MSSDYTLQELYIYLYPTITTLTRMPVPGRISPDSISPRDYDKLLEYINLLDNQLTIETWCESHHNGSVFGEKTITVDLVGDLYDKAIRVMESAALAKSRGEEETKKRELQEKEDRTILYGKVKFGV